MTGKKMLTVHGPRAESRQVPEEEPLISANK